MKIKATIQRIKGGEALRTESMQGYYYHPPRTGERFQIIGGGLMFGTRLINTSPVTDIKEYNNGIIFSTESGSEYAIRHDS